MDLKDTIRSIKDFPEKGIIFRDITTLLKDGNALRQAVDEMADALSDVDYDLYSVCLLLTINVKALCLSEKKASFLLKQ